MSRLRASYHLAKTRLCVPEQARDSGTISFHPYRYRSTERTPLWPAPFYFHTHPHHTARSTKMPIWLRSNSNLTGYGPEKKRQGFPLRTVELFPFRSLSDWVFSSALSGNHSFPIAVSFL